MLCDSYNGKNKSTGPENREFKVVRSNDNGRKKTCDLLMAWVRPNIGLGNEKVKVMRAEIIKRKHGVPWTKKEEEFVIMVEKNMGSGK